MRGRFRHAVCAALAAGALAIGVPVAASGHGDHRFGLGRDQPQQIKHVLLISVDGLHQSDLQWYVAHHPDSELAKLTNGASSSPTRTRRSRRTRTPVAPRS